MLQPSHEALFAALADVALAWQPRDVVGGDFYHFVAYADGWSFVLADCTGHGVPGAFMTLIASSRLAHALERIGPRDPARLLVELNRGVKSALAQDEPHVAGGVASDDGLDALVLWFEHARAELTFASARVPLHLLARDAAEVRTIDGERMGLGYVGTPASYAWTNRSVTLGDGDVVCAATDGVVDQIGGSKHIAFGKRRLREAMVHARARPMPEFAAALLAAHADYQAGHRRRDDLTLFCFRTARASVR
ncbi:MAG TPA: SpoIIE family protein phosphatase [Dokdonella sp.]